MGDQPYDCEVSSQSLEDLARAFREKPEDGDTAFAYAQALDARNREDEAIPVYRHTLRCQLAEETECRASVQLASSLRVVGQLQEAIKLHREIADRWPN